jgi:prepilin signal peptidase PulO-like enzyme (type II secretory pathway)
MSNAVLLSFIALASVSDLRYRKVKNYIVFPCFLTGLVLSFAHGGAAGLADSILAALYVFTALFPFFSARLIGAGDIKVRVQFVLPLVAMFLFMYCIDFSRNLNSGSPKNHAGLVLAVVIPLIILYSALMQGSRVSMLFMSDLKVFENDKHLWKPAVHQMDEYAEKSAQMLREFFNNLRKKN